MVNHKKKKQFENNGYHIKYRNLLFYFIEAFAQKYLSIIYLFFIGSPFQFSGRIDIDNLLYIHIYSEDTPQQNLLNAVP